MGWIRLSGSVLIPADPQSHAAEPECGSAPLNVGQCRVSISAPLICFNPPVCVLTMWLACLNSTALTDEAI